MNESNQKGRRLRDKLTLRPRDGLSASNAAAIPTGNHILDQTLLTLNAEDRKTLKEYIRPDTCDATLQEALAAAKQKQETFLDKRQKLQFGERTVILRDQVDKVVDWLHRFKEVGDIAVNADPVCVGLPWAGIRLLLEAAASDANRMAALLVGCETALRLADRLRVYTRALNEQEPCQEQRNMEAAVISMYAHLLGFLAQAIRTYQTSTVRRIISSIWTVNDIAKFEQKCNESSVQLDIEASNCERRKQEGMREEQRRHHQMVIDQARDSILDKIPMVTGAIFNSVDSTHTMCHPQTRVDLLKQIHSWISHPQGKSIFWLSGPAGTGKSTISWTVAREMECHGLAASFFFKRGEGDRGSAARFFPTLARQMANNIPGMTTLIAAAVRTEPWLCSKSLSEQFQRLIAGPLGEVDTQSTYLVVVDALDECDKSTDVETILQLWTLLPSNRLKLFITSRHEPPIRRSFAAMRSDYHDDMMLQQAVPPETLRHDLGVYILDELGKICHEHSIQPVEKLGDKLEQLVQLCDPLFIIAATVCRFVGDMDWDPEERLEEILNGRGTGQLSQMERTYLPVLNQILARAKRSDDGDKLIRQFQTVIGSITCLVEPLSAGALASLTGIPEKLVRSRLDLLHAVLLIPEDTESPIRILHQSFPEFLLERGRKDGPFGVDGTKTHLALRDNCLRIMSKLHRNMCDLELGQLRCDVDSSLVAGRLSPALRYACRYWVHHLQQSQSGVDAQVYAFLREHFLHWLEALSLMGCLAEAISLVETLTRRATEDVSLFLQDAYRFVLANRFVGDLAPMQLYMSASVFAPQTSHVRRECGHSPKWLLRHPTSPESWGPELQKLWGHLDEVNSVTFSPDGSLLASGSSDQTIRLWDAKTGQELQKLETNGQIWKVAFSPDGLMLVSQSETKPIRLWDIRTGQEIYKTDLRVHGYSVADIDSTWNATIKPIFQKTNPGLGGGQRLYSLDGLLYATQPEHNTIEIHNSKEHQRMYALQHNDQVIETTFSHQGSFLASRTWKSIYIWNLKTGQNEQVFHELIYLVSMAFSHDESMLAMGRDGEILVWDVSSWTVVQQLRGQNYISALAFSPAGILASGSWDTKISLWDVRGEQAEPMKSSSYIRSMKFSPDGSRLLKERIGGPVSLWNTDSGQRVWTRGKEDEVCRGAFAPLGSLFAVSVDGKIALWDWQTLQMVQRLTDGRDLSSEITSLCFSPDQALLAQGLGDGTISLLDVGTGQVRRSLRVPMNNSNKPLKLSWRNEITDLLFSPGGDLLAWQFHLNALRFFDIRTGQEVRVIKNVPSNIMEIKFTLDGRSLATNQGVYNFDSEFLSHSLPESMTYHDEWIQFGETKLVWLPQEYRLGRWASYSTNTLAIGEPLGDIGIWEVEPTLLFKQPS